MILVVGGIASGKRSYVRTLGYADAQMSEALSSEAPVLLALEERLRKGPLTEDEREALARKQVVICCEVGQGVVPIDAGERAWRELVGRTCAELAACSERVVRLVCGIPTDLLVRDDGQEGSGR